MIRCLFTVLFAGGLLSLPACGSTQTTSTHKWPIRTAYSTTAASSPDNPLVLLQTNVGPIVVELYPDKAPITVKNFLTYVDNQHYDGTIFHRVIPTFMIQGGGFNTKLVEKPTREPIPNEAANGLLNQRGTLAMARTPDPDSATAQFFINVVDNDFLDKQKSPDGFGYCVFGKVIDGMDVVDAIKDVPTADINIQGREMEKIPLEQVIIESAKRLN
ncbi:MAG: peptidylprolyl isomerase [Gemmataceae bacterium]